MQEQDLENLTIAKLAQLIRRKDISPVELTSLFLERIKRLNPAITAYTLLMEDQALSDSRAAEKQILRKRYKGSLHGIPFSIKDNIAIKGQRTTAGTKVLADWKPDYDATVVSKIKESGGIIFGKTNMHEWASGGSTINPYYGTTHNPWDLGRIPGGSSGGAAAALASGMCLASIGTDNAGSVRNPASLCGVVGLKATYGRVSRFGGVPGTGAFSMDHFGIFTKTVEDSALVLQAVAGYDPKDPLTADEPVSKYSKAIGKKVKGLKVGLLGGYFEDPITDEVRAGFTNAVRLLESLGMTIVEVSVPHLHLSPAVHTCTSRVENVAAQDIQLRTNPHAYSRETLFRQILALTIPASTYVTAQRVRRLIADELNQVLQKVHVIAAPTTPTTAPTIEEYEKGALDLDGKKLYLQDEKGALGIRFTIPFNLTGHPAISICCGFSGSGMPIGMQIVGRRFQEEMVFRIAHAYESAAQWYRRPSAKSIKDANR